MVEAQIRARIEELVAEDHELLSHHSEKGLDAEGHARHAQVKAELDSAWDLLRRVQAGQHEALADADVPDPPNDLEGPEPEPLHLDHGVHGEGASPDPGDHRNAP